MRILVVNVNTSQTMTSVIEAGARRYASAGTQIIALQPYFGAEAVDCNFESYLSAVAVHGPVPAPPRGPQPALRRRFRVHRPDRPPALPPPHPRGIPPSPAPTAVDISAGATGG